MHEGLYDAFVVTLLIVLSFVSLHTGLFPGPIIGFACFIFGVRLWTRGVKR